ncbi:hypothetical protein ACMFL9_31145 [Sinorhizobium meliloti]
MTEITAVGGDQRLVPVERRMKVGEIGFVLGKRQPPAENPRLRRSHFWLPMFSQDEGTVTCFIFLSNGKISFQTGVKAWKTGPCRRQGAAHISPV